MNTTHAGCCINVASSEGCLVDIKVNCIVCVRVHHTEAHSLISSLTDLSEHESVWYV